MIRFNYQTTFSLEDETEISQWISATILEEAFKEGQIDFVFCSDAYLHKINMDFLKHDTLTDIISFDYSVGKELHGEIYISVDRVKENSSDLAIGFMEELSRVMIHGILHYCKYNDKTVDEMNEMRAKEDYYLAKRN